MSDATVAAQCGCTIYALRQHRKAGEKYCRRCQTWKPKTEFPLGGGAIEKRKNSCVACHAARARRIPDVAVGEVEASPELAARMHELLEYIV